MAYGLQNFPNIHSVDSDYPNGDVKDDTGANDGTPINRQTTADMYQFFAKLMRETNTTPNNLPDNEYNGLQYYEAAKVAFGRHGSIFYVPDGSPASMVVSPLNHPLIIATPSVTAGWNIVFETAGDDEEFHRCCVTVKNLTSGNIGIFSDVSYPVEGTTAGYVLASGQTKTFIFDGTVRGPQWWVCG